MKLCTLSTTLSITHRDRGEGDDGGTGGASVLRPLPHLDQLRLGGTSIEVGQLQQGRSIALGHLGVIVGWNKEIVVGHRMFTFTTTTSLTITILDANVGTLAWIAHKDGQREWRAHLDGAVDLGGLREAALGDLHPTVHTRLLATLVLDWNLDKKEQKGC